MTDKDCPVGICKCCKLFVYIDDYKVNINGFYYHYECYKLWEGK